MRTSFVAAFSWCLWAPAAFAQTAAYRPLGQWLAVSEESAIRFQKEVSRRTVSQQATTGSARPVLPGYRAESVELLEDSMKRKHVKRVGGDSVRARDMALRMVPRQIPQLRGYMAEALFVQRNPQWHFVNSPNASQHDVYSRRYLSSTALNGSIRWVPFNGQIKYHDSGDPSAYARDMVKDHRAHRFFIPDDHLEKTKSYLRAKAERLTASGRMVEAGQRWKDLGRLEPLGATSQEIRNATDEAVKAMQREKHASYVSLGASLGVAFSGTAWGWLRGDLSANTAVYRVMQAGTGLWAAIAADQALRGFGKGALRGTFRGNALVGAAVMATETGWALYEDGWQGALPKPDFYERLFGSAGGRILGLAAGGRATFAAAPTGPAAPFVGLRVGVAAGTVGCLGGTTVERAVVDLASPECVH